MKPVNRQGLRHPADALQRLDGGRRALHDEGKARDKLARPAGRRESLQGIDRSLDEPVAARERERPIGRRRLAIESAKRDRAGFVPFFPSADQDEVISQNQVAVREERHGGLPCAGGPEEDVGEPPANQSGAVEEKPTVRQAPVRRDDAEEILHGPMQAVTLRGREGQLSFPGGDIVPPGEFVGEGEQPIAFPPLLETIELRRSGARLSNLEKVRNLRLHHPNPRLFPRENGIAGEEAVAGPDLRLILAGQPLQAQ